MISPFEVYLVMQLDHVRAAFEAVLTITLTLSFLSCSLIVLFWKDFEPETRDKIRAHAPVKTLVAFVFFCASMVIFLPSTKTVAAMIIVPALTSDEVIEPVTKETRDLYSLAKQALKATIEEEKDDATDSDER